MDRCVSMDRALPSLLIPPRALLSCCRSKRWRYPYETAPYLALPGENGPLQALALPASRGVVEHFQPVVSPGGTDHPLLLRYAHRSGTSTHGHDGIDRAAGGA